MVNLSRDLDVLDNVLYNFYNKVRGVLYVGLLCVENGKLQEFPTSHTYAPFNIEKHKVFQH